MLYGFSDARFHRKALSCCTAAVQSVENFDKIWTEQRPVDSPCGTPTDPSYAGAFEGFTYIAPSFMASSMEALAAAKAAQQ
jgi:hypothetical protein